MEFQQRPLLVAVVKLSRIWSMGRKFFRRLENPVLVTLPAAILFRIFFLPGAMDGIRFFVQPDWNKLLHIQTWYKVVVDALMSSIISFGTIGLSVAYNPFKRGAFRDALIVSVLDSSAALLIGLAVFALCGNLAYTTGSSLPDLLFGGSEIIPNVYSPLVARFSSVPVVAYSWSHYQNSVITKSTKFLPLSVLSTPFALMFMVMGIAVAVSLTGSLVTFAYGEFPAWKRWLVTCSACLVGLPAGIVPFMPNNLQYLRLMEYSGAGSMLLVLITAQLITIWCCHRTFPWRKVRHFLQQSAVVRS